MTPLFDRALLRQRRDRAAAGFDGFDFLFREVGERLLDRLDDVRRDFVSALDLGARNGALAAGLRQRGIATVVETDLSGAMLRLGGSDRLVVQADEEALPFGPGSFDLAMANLSLHWANDLPGVLVQLFRAMRPDGFFLASLFGGDTLFELRRSLMEAEVEATGGLSPRISPFTDVRDAGGLLMRAGFALPVADVDEITVDYAHPLKLLADLRGMGETNIVAERSRTPLPRGLLMDALARYTREFGTRDGRVVATFRIVTLSGWSPHESQQQPLRPGSAKMRLADALKAIDPASGGGDAS